MQVEIDIERYFTEEDIKDIAEDEIRDYVGREVNDYFHRNKYPGFIVDVAKDAFWEAVGKLGDDTMGAVRRQVRKEIMNMSVYSLIGTRFNATTAKEEPTVLQKIIDEESEKMRPEIAGIIREAALSKIGSGGAEILTDAFYNLISQAFEREKDRGASDDD